MDVSIKHTRQKATQQKREKTCSKQRPKGVA